MGVWRPTLPDIRLPLSFGHEKTTRQQRGGFREKSLLYMLELHGDCIPGAMPIDPYQEILPLLQVLHGVVCVPHWLKCINLIIRNQPSAHVLAFYVLSLKVITFACESKKNSALHFCGLLNQEKKTVEFIAFLRF